MAPRFRLLVTFDGDALHVGAEQDVEGLAWVAVDGVFAGDDELVEEGLVGEASQRVVNAHVDRVAVASEGEAVVQVGLRLLVLDVAGVDLRVEEREPAGDAVLLGGEQVERDGSGVVSLQKFGAFVAEGVAFGGVGVAFLPCGGVEPVELCGDEFPERGDDVLGYLDVAVVVLDGGFDVGHEHGLAFAVGALGVPAGADEVRVDHVLSAAGVGEDQPRAALAAVEGAFEVVVVGLGLLPGGLVRGEDGLDPVPDLGGSSPGVLVSAVRHG